MPRKLPSTSYVKTALKQQKAAQVTSALLSPPPSPGKKPRTPRTPKLKLPLSSLASQFRHLKPSWRTYIEYAALAAKEGDKDMEKYMAVYSSLSKKEIASHSPEQVCDLSNIKPSELFGSVCRKLWECSTQEASMITAIHHPILIEKTAKFAAQAKNVKDREMFHKATGFLPTPKGAHININNSPQTLIAGGGVMGALPSMSSDMGELEDVDFLPPANKQLEEGGIIDAEETDESDEEDE